jgi:hypothetical protein
MSGSYSTTALLKLYGSKAVNVTDVIQHFYPDAGVAKPANPQDLKIGTEYVPPLGGISIIDPNHVANAGYANRLRQAGYRPQATASHQANSSREITDSWIPVVLICGVGLIGLVVATTLYKKG